MIRLAYDDLDRLNVQECPGVSTFDSFRIMLSDFSYPFTRELISEIEDNSIRFYPIQPVSFDLAFSDKSKSIPDYIPEITLKKLQNHENNLCLLIFFAWEGFDLQFFNYLIPSFFNRLSNEFNIPSEKIFWIYGDLKIRTSLEKSPVKISLPESNIIGYNIFEYVANHDSRKVNFKIPSIDKGIRSKKFLYKNGVARSHRTYLAGALNSKNLLDKCYFSWLNSQKLDYDIHEGSYINGVFSMYNSSVLRTDYMESFEQIRKKEPITIDITQEESYHRENQTTVTVKHYRDSYCSLVTESVFDEYDSGTLFFSEKIYQPIYNFHPFIVVSGQGMLEVLRSQGYLTFPELFDETYDTLKNSSDRMGAIINEVEKFCHTPDKVHMDIFTSNEFQNKLIHNWELFLKRSGRSLFEEMIQRLEIKEIPKLKLL